MEFATGALGALLSKLGQLLQDEYNLHKDTKKNIESLKRELKSIEAALQKVGSIPLEQLDQQVRIWVHEAREASYDMEDIVDTFLVRVQGTERTRKRSADGLIKEIKGFVTKVKMQRDIGQEINKIKNASRKLLSDVTGTIPMLLILLPKPLMLTLGDDTSVQKQRIISIVGFGGLGKTTLAKAVHDKLKEKFDCTAFVPVGRNPDLKKVLSDILIDLDKKQYMSSSLALDQIQLINESHGFLEKKRYFIVIDDVWDTIANEAGEVYNLQPLSDDNSRKLFFGRVSIGERKFSDHQVDDEVSDKILKKCEGIPLAIITMASLLAGKPWEEWSEVHHSIGFTNKENRQVENTKKIISFSYYDLPSQLRTCLLYLSVYPEDYSIKKGPLIWMWIAEGFVHADHGISSFEIGEGYFNQLVNRSMIQLVELEENDKEFSCRIHDMVLDLIPSISHEENFVTFLDNNNEGASSSEVRVRRLALQNIRDGEAHVKNMQQVRSFISLGFDIKKGPPLSSFKFIRVLAVYYIERRHMKHLRYLVHLRYLRINGGLNVEIPEEIASLKFLQTLDVGGFLVGKLATSVCFLTQQLLCLRLGSSVSILFTDGISKLTSLMELHIGFGYHAERSEEEALRRFMKELGSLRELRVLDFHCLHPLSMELQINLVESLRNLEKIEHLSLSIRSLDFFHATVDTAAWEEVGFLLSWRLQQLFLDGISFSRFPSRCINSLRLPKLSQLSLRVDYIDEQDLRIIGGLPHLGFLQLNVKCTLEVACNTSNTDDDGDESLEMNVPTTTDAAGDDGYLFKKLRFCSLWYDEVRLVPSKDGVPFRMKWVNASVLLDSEWEGVCSRGKGLVPTLMPRTQKLWFTVVSVQEFKDENHGCCDSLCLEYFASLQNIRLRIYNSSGSDAEEEEVKAALQRGADLHPNRPRLHAEPHQYCEYEMISAAQDEELAGTSEGD
ncbi:unnamed protein product [Urochloa decumbens]|uniref:Uncharacterized protein n=1 Tax=Urochloa decumbens TaxID=240449 RepID=A0ABC9H5G3_9POAL